jgi:hypothetical protein
LAATATSSTSGGNSVVKISSRFMNTLQVPWSVLAEIQFSCPGRMNPALQGGAAGGRSPSPVQK